MFIRSIVLSFLLLLGAEAVCKASISNLPVQSAQLRSNHIVYQWIDGVRWAFVYAEDGTLLSSYPDPE